MRLVCPNCQAAYEIPDTLLGAPGRRLRCARCATEWSPAAAMAAGPAASIVERAAAVGADAGIPPLAPPSLVPVASAPAMPVAPVSARIGADTAPTVRGESRPSLVSSERPASRSPGAPAARRTSGATIALAWIFSLAVIGGAVASAYVWRENIMAAWPASQRLYAALGMR